MPTVLDTDQALYEHCYKLNKKKYPSFSIWHKQTEIQWKILQDKYLLYTNFKNMEYRLFQLGLTAIEYKGK